MKSLPLATAVAFALITPSFSASLRSTLDVKSSGGTASASFVESSLPSFLLSGSGGSFRIQAAGIVGGDSWQFLVDGQGRAELLAAPTVPVDRIGSFANGQREIAHHDLELSADRFAPDPVGFLIGRLGEDYFAFETAKWNPSDVRFRIYSDVREIPAPSVSESVPEVRTGVLTLLSCLLLLRARRR